MAAGGGEFILLLNRPLVSQLIIAAPNNIIKLGTDILQATYSGMRSAILVLESINTAASILKIYFFHTVIFYVWETQEQKTFQSTISLWYSSTCFLI